VKFDDVLDGYIVTSGHASPDTIAGPHRRPQSRNTRPASTNNEEFWSTVDVLRAHGVHGRSSRSPGSTPLSAARNPWYVDVEPVELVHTPQTAVRDDTADLIKVKASSPMFHYYPDNDKAASGSLLHPGPKMEVSRSAGRNVTTMPALPSIANEELEFLDHAADHGTML